MTEEIPAGPQLDRLVAEKVMGWEFVADDPSIGEGGYADGAGTLKKLISEWSPSTNLNDAWELVEKIAGNFYDVAVMLSQTNTAYNEKIYACEISDFGDLLWRG
jgi:hypothetical protein